jgi:hypothetical protein
VTNAGRATLERNKTVAQIVFAAGCMGTRFSRIAVITDSTGK